MVDELCAAPTVPNPYLQHEKNFVSSFKFKKTNSLTFEKRMLPN